MTGKRRKKVPEEDPKNSNSSSKSKLQKIKELPSRYHIYFIPPCDKEQKYCTIEVEGVEIYVHKDIIAEKSTVLASMLKNNWKEAQTGHIGLPGKTLKSFMLFVDCLHQKQETVRDLKSGAPTAVELMNLAWLANEYDATEPSEIAKNALVDKIRYSYYPTQEMDIHTNDKLQVYKLALQCLKMEEYIGSSTSQLYKTAIVMLERANFHALTAAEEYNNLEQKTKLDITTAKCQKEKKEEVSLYH